MPWTAGTDHGGRSKAVRLAPVGTTGQTRLLNRGWLGWPTRAGHPGTEGFSKDASSFPLAESDLVVKLVTSIVSHQHSSQDSVAP